MNNRLTQSPLKILLASSEAESLIGNGDLAEFTTTLCASLATLGHDIRLVLPAYTRLLEKSQELSRVSRIRLPGLETPVTILQGRLPNGVQLYLVQIPALFQRPGSIYRDAQHQPWPDNGLRFGFFSRAVSLIAINQAGLNWQPEVLHCNGWQSGLAMSMIATEWNRPATLLTLHQDTPQQFVADQVTPLSLPVALLKSGALSVDQGFSFEKGALLSADRVTLPSPGYRAELLDGTQPHHLADLLRERAELVTGVTAGVDYQRWSPTTDPFIEQHYDSASFELKQLNRQRLLAAFDLSLDDGVLLIGYNADNLSDREVALIQDLLPRIEHSSPIHLIASVNGDTDRLGQIERLAARYPLGLTVQTTDSDRLRHRIVASSDCLLLPADAYPSAHQAQCALSYGTVPIAHGTGAMRETLTDATASNLLHGVATGFLYEENTPEGLQAVLERVTAFRTKPDIWWQKLALQGMAQNFSAAKSAQHYLQLYRSAIDQPAASPIPG